MSQERATGRLPEEKTGMAPAAGKMPESFGKLAQVRQEFVYCAVPPEESGTATVAAIGTAWRPGLPGDAFTGVISL